MNRKGSPNDGYKLLAAEVVKSAARDYERGYRFLKYRFGNKENFQKDSELYQKVFEGRKKAAAGANLVQNYLTAKSFLKSDRLKIYTDIDGGKIMEHIEGLIDSGSNLKEQSERARKYFEKMDRYRAKFFEEEDF